jgi:hypothetical protein
MSENSKGLNQVIGKDGRTYLYANSGDVSLATGVATELLNFRSPNAVSTMSFEIFIPSALLVSGDRFTIKWYQDANTVQKYDFLQTTTGGREGNMPIIINKVVESNTPVIVEINYAKSGSGAPAVTGCVNMSGRVY